MFNSPIKIKDTRVYGLAADHSNVLAPKRQIVFGETIFRNNKYLLA